MKRFLRTGALLCSTISIFLCGRFSARAQDGLLYEAACFERLAFDAADAVSRSDALAGRLDEFDAVSEEIDTAAYCSGSPVAAAFRAASEYIEGNRPALKSQDRAFRLSFLPPAAHIYADIAPAVDEYNKRALNEFRARLGEYLSTEGYCLCSPLWMP